MLVLVKWADYWAAGVDARKGVSRIFCSAHGFLFCINHPTMLGGSWEKLRIDADLPCRFEIGVCVQLCCPHLSRGKSQDAGRHPVSDLNRCSTLFRTGSSGSSPRGKSNISQPAPVPRPHRSSTLSPLFFSDARKSKGSVVAVSIRSALVLEFAPGAGRLHLVLRLVEGRSQYSGTRHNAVAVRVIVPSMFGPFHDSSQSGDERAWPRPRHPLGPALGTLWTLACQLSTLHNTPCPHPCLCLIPSPQPRSRGGRP